MYKSSTFANTTYMMENLDFKKDFESALENNEFHVFLQPKFDSKTEKLVGVEALVRRIIDEKIFMPDSFISIYEQNELGFITSMDDFGVGYSSFFYYRI